MSVPAAGIQFYEDWQSTSDATIHGLSFVDFVRVHWIKRGRRGWPPSTEEATGEVSANINHGRWMADLPCDCGCSFVVSELTPVVICIYCGSPENGGNWYRVVFPAPAQRRIIEGRLLERPAVRNRNWRPGEPVRGLARENQAHRTDRG